MGHTPSPLVSPGSTPMTVTYFSECIFNWRMKFDVMEQQCDISIPHFTHTALFLAEISYSLYANETALGILAISQSQPCLDHACLARCTLQYSYQAKYRQSSASCNQPCTVLRVNVSARQSCVVNENDLSGLDNSHNLLSQQVAHKISSLFGQVSSQVSSL